MKTAFTLDTSVFADPVYETIPTKRFVGSTFIWYDVSIDIIGNCTGDTNEKVSVWSSSFDINPYEIYSRVMYTDIIISR